MSSSLMIAPDTSWIVFSISDSTLNLKKSLSLNHFTINLVSYIGSPWSISYPAVSSASLTSFITYSTVAHHSKHMIGYISGTYYMGGIPFSGSIEIMSLCYFLLALIAVPSFYFCKQLFPSSQNQHFNELWKCVCLYNASIYQTGPIKPSISRAWAPRWSGSVIILFNSS